MAHHHSAKRRIRRNARREVINGNRVNRIRTFVKNVETAIVSGDKQAAADAFRLALRQNLDLRSERYATDIAEMEIKKAKGVFDAFVFSDFSYDFSSEPLSSQLQGSDIFFFKRDTTLFDIGMGKPVRTGGLMELKLDMNRYESNSSFLIINPYYSTHLSLSFSQPLLKPSKAPSRAASAR